MIRRPPRSTLDRSSAASDVYKRQVRITQVETVNSNRHIRENLDLFSSTQRMLEAVDVLSEDNTCLLYTSPSPRDRTRSRMPSSA